jgi:site-specific DNA-methyltransferase (cytosine-N4-specific)
VQFLTDKGDTVLDPFAGSNTTGAVAEGLGRRWLSVEADWQYAAHSISRFAPDVIASTCSGVRVQERQDDHAAASSSSSDTPLFTS